MRAARVLKGAFVTLAAISLSSHLRAEETSTKVLDLNQIDMEQVEDNWDSGGPATRINPDANLKIKDIVEPTSEYTYASFGKQDPFALPSSLLGPQSTLDEAADSTTRAAVGSKEITVTSPLQGYPLSALVVRGVWQTAEGEFRAVIQTPKREGVVVKLGDPISSGKILTIEKDSIMVRLYKLRNDGVREYDDSRMSFGATPKVSRSTIKLEPGKEAQFPNIEEPADADSAQSRRNAANPAVPVVNADVPGGAAAANAGGAKAAPPPVAGQEAPGMPFNPGAGIPVPAAASGRPGANIK